MDASLPTAQTALDTTSVSSPGPSAAYAPRGVACDALRLRRFRLFPSARLLLCDDAPVEIGSRAFDLLHLLLRSRGAVVERAEIFRQVWPTTIVDESNLRFQVSCLRRILGSDRNLLKTVPGRGYMIADEAQTERDAPQEGDHRRLPVKAATGGEDPDPAIQILGALLSAMLEEIRAMRRPDRAMALLNEGMSPTASGPAPASGP